MRAPIRLAVLLAVATVALAGPASAYIINAKSVFRRFAEKQALDRATSGELTGRATLARTSAAPEREAPVRLTLTFPTTCAATIELPDGNASAAFASGKVSTDGIALPALTAYATLGCPFAVMKNVPAAQAETTLARLASSLGVEQSVVSLQRLERTPAYVVGAKPQQKDRPQLWFDKASTRPIRVVGRVNGELWDVRFENPSSPATSRRHPRIVEVWKGPERQLRLKLMSAEAGTETDEGGETVEDLE